MGLLTLIMNFLCALQILYFYDCCIIFISELLFNENTISINGLYILTFLIFAKILFHMDAEVILMSIPIINHFNQ